MPEIRLRAILTLGRCRQKGRFALPGPIEWMVLGLSGRSALLLSRYALTSRVFHREQYGIPWEACSLRRWLNTRFLYSVFSAKERARLETFRVTADPNPVYPDGDPGNDTQDKVFLLSIAEVQRYLPTNEQRRCMPTPRARQEGAETERYAGCSWWLRTPGYNEGDAAIIGPEGYIDETGDNVSFRGVGVRPAVVLRLK